MQRLNYGWHFLDWQHYWLPFRQQYARLNFYQYFAQFVALSLADDLHFGQLVLQQRFFRFQLYWHSAQFSKFLVLRVLLGRLRDAQHSIQHVLPLQFHVGDVLYSLLRVGQPPLPHHVVSEYLDIVEHQRVLIVQSRSGCFYHEQYPRQFYCLY